MKLFAVKATGPYALEVYVVSAESAEQALALVPSDPFTFHSYEAVEIVPDGVPGIHFSASHVE